MSDSFDKWFAKDGVCHELEGDREYSFRAYQAATAAADAEWRGVVEKLVERFRNIELAMGSAAEGAGMPEFEIYLHNEAYARESAELAAEL